MDDGGQRLLDVIEDPHALDIFLRENLSNSALEENSRYDTSNNEGGLVNNGGLDNFVFDGHGQLVDPLRGGQAHTSHHSHQVNSHVLQQVLHPTSLSAASTLPGSSHQLHHQIHHHHQTHHLQQSNLLQQHHAQQQHLQHAQQQHQSNHPPLPSPIGGSALDVDCIGRNRDSSCSGNRNESDHTLQQLLASASPIGSSQQILQLHHQAHHHSLHQSHSTQLQHLNTQSHQHLQQQQQSQQQHQQSHHNQSLLPSPIPPPVPSSNSLLQHHVDQSSHRQQTQRQQHQQQQQQQQQQHQQQRHHASQSHKSLSHQNASTHESQTQLVSDLSNSILPIGLQSVTTSSSSCNGNISTQPSSSNSVSASQQDVSRLTSKTLQGNSSVNNSTSKIVSGISSQNIVHSGSHGITTSRVQVMGGHNQVLSSATQQLLAPSTSQLFSGTQIVQPSIPTQVISGGSILAGGQVLSAPNVLPGGQVLSSVPSGQVFQGSQLLSNAQVLTNHLLNTSHVITTVAGIPAPTAPLYVTPSAVASQIHQPPPPPPPVIQNAIGSVHQNVITSSLTPLSSPSTASSTFTVPSKSPASSLPRTSPGPSYPATPSPHHTTPSPASYPNKSPAPSPHSNASTLKSPVPTSSPAVSATSQSVQAVGNVSSSSHNSAALVSGVVGNVSMVQGLVPHLPITKVGGSNGVVLAPGGNSMQVTTGIKQVVQGGQLIQIVSSQNNPTRQTVTIPHPKPIQPKQPQLLPKPSPQGGVRQPTPPPSGKTLIGTRPTPPNSQQPIVLGTSNQQPTVITGQQNLGSFVLNSSLLQPGLQQPILIPQPNGVQLLVRPAGHPTGAAGQTLLVPMPSQSQVVTSMGKVPQHQTLVIPGSGQTPALVIPQGLTPALGGAGMLNAAQNARAPQPIIRLVAPHAPLQLQQINTASGPMLVAVPVNQTALNLPGVFATASSSMRTLSPQVTPGTLQIGSSLGPVSLNPLQMAPGSLQVNNTSQPLSLSASLPTPLSSVITTTTTTTMATRSSEDSLALSTSPIQSNIQLSAQPPSVDTSNKNNSKKKSKKKKKEKDSKEDKGKGKGVSINLNELLKETGIFDENEFGGLGVEDTDANLGASHGLVLPPPQQTSLPPTTSVIGTSINCKISTSPGQLILSTPVSQPISSVSLSHNITPSIITSSSVSTFGQNTLPVTSVPTSMCFTFDVHGKLVLGPSDSGKPHITAIAGSVPTQLMSPSGVGLNLNSGGTFVIGNNEPASIPVTKSPVTGGPTVGHIVALHPPTVSQLGDISQSSTLMKIDNTHQLLASSKAITSSPQNHMEIIKTVQNNNMVQSQPDKSINNSHSILTSILSNSVSPIIGVNTGNPETNISVSLTGTDKVNYINTDGKQLTDYSSNGIITSHPSQLPINPAVIVSSYANTFLPGAIISSKTPTSSFNILTSSNSVSNPKSSLVNTLSASVQSSEKNILYSPYTSNLNSSSVESKIKKSSKKKKKDKESAASQTTTIYSANQIHQDKSKSSSLSAYVGSSSSPILIQNGSISPSSLASISKLENNKIDHGPLLTNGQTIPQATPVYSSSTLNYLTSVSNTTVTSNSIVSTMSNSKPSTHVSLSTNLTNSVTEGAKLSFPIISTHSSLSGPTSSFIVQPGQQVKQLLLSPQNQEALKRVHSQIQDIQNKKGSLSEQDKALQQKLISEYKKIMATGTPVPMSQSSLSQLSHNINTSQHNPIKYSHSVGHKKIYLTPNQKKGYPQTNHQSSKKHNPEPNKVNDSKLKENNDPVTASCVSSSNTFSSHSATTTSGFHVSVAVSTAVNNSCVSSISNASTPVHQLVSPVVQESECVKSLLENESIRHVNVGTEPVTCRNHSPSRASMPLIIANTKTSPTLPGIITTSSIPLTTTTTTYQPVIDMQSVPVSPHINISNVAPVSCAAPSPVLTPQLSSTSQVIHPPLSSPTCTTSSSSALTSTQTLPIGAAGISLVPQHQQSQSQSSTVSTNNPIRTIASLPRTREELFEIHLKTDHNGVLNPDYRTPFKSKTDVCKRLIRYHVYNDFSPSQQELLHSEYQFELHGEALIKKFNAMKYKYKSLLLKDSMRRHPSAETAMLYRYFVTDERATLEREKLEVANGKELDLPPPPPHWVGGDLPPAGPPFPWEEEWHNDKAYVVSYDQVEEEEEGEKNDEEKAEGFSSLNVHTKEGEKYFVSSPLGDDGRTSRANSQWEDDLEEECQDEGRLQILMEDETDESKSQDADLVEEEEGPGSLLSDNGGYFSRSPVNYDDSDKETVVQDGRTSSGGGSNIDCNRQRSYSSEKDNNKCIYNNKYNIKESWSSNDNCYTPYSKFPVRNVYENEINSSETVPGTKENGIEEHVDSSIGSRNNCVPESHAIGAFDSSVSSYHSKIKEFCDGKISCNSDIYYNSSNQMELSKLGKYNKHDRKPKSERDKRKRDRSREKSSRYSEKEEKARSSKKLKIKLKHEEKAVVRPLRIKSDERTSGGLKLTLKKQEGSSGYYRVGDERGREYRVEPSKEEVESTLLPVLENQSNGKGDSSSGEQQQQHLRGVSVVLEDCLQVEPKNKKELDSPMRGYNKRSKRLKSSHHHHQNSINDEFNSDRYHERENNVSWSSRFVDTVSTGVDKFIDSSSNLAAPSSRSNNHNANYYYQSSHSRQYSLEPSSLSHFRKQPLCVPSSGQQKVIHQQQTPRNSQRLS